MGKHRRAVNGTDKVRVKAGGVLLTGLLSGAVATGAFTGAPTATASCFSAFGIGNGNGCTSNMTTIAIGIGEGAVADASFGILGSAVAIGTNANATNSISAFTGAFAFGDNATASALFSIFSTLAQFGPGLTAVIGGPNIAIGASAGGPPQTTSVLGGFNIGAQLGPGSTQVLGGLNFALGVSPFGNGEQETVAGLFATFALNLISDSVATAQGVLVAAVNVLGQTLWPPAVLTALINFIGSVFPGLAPPPAPLAPEPAISLFAMEANEFSAQGEPETALAEVNDEFGNAAARAGALVPTDELPPAEAPAEIEVIDESPDFTVNDEETELDGDPDADMGSVPEDTVADKNEETELHGDLDAVVPVKDRDDDTVADKRDDVVAAKNEDDGPAGTATGATGTSGAAGIKASPGDTNTGDDHSKDSSNSENAST